MMFQTSHGGICIRFLEGISQVIQKAMYFFHGHLHVLCLRRFLQVGGSTSGGGGASRTSMVDVDLPGASPEKLTPYIDTI